MTWRHELSYVLRHAWLWPLVFWMRPLDVLERLESHRLPWMESAAAGAGGAVWGIMAGSLLWFWTGEVHAIWSLGIAGALAGALAFAGPDAGTGALAGALASVFTGAAMGAGTGAAMGAAFVVIVAALGISIGIWFPYITLYLVIGVVIIFIVFTLWKLLDKTVEGFNIPDWADNTCIVTWFIGMPIAAFLLFPHSPAGQTPI